MMRGFITTLSPGLPLRRPADADGARDRRARPAQGLQAARGRGHLHATRRDWQIAQQIARRHDLRVEVDRGRARAQAGRAAELDDAPFLKERAALIDFDVFMRTDPKTGEDVLHFVKPSDGRGVRADPHLRARLGHPAQHRRRAQPDRVQADDRRRRARCSR